MIDLFNWIVQSTLKLAIDSLAVHSEAAGDLALAVPYSLQPTAYSPEPVILASAIRASIRLRTSRMRSSRLV